MAAAKATKYPYVSFAILFVKLLGKVEVLLKKWKHMARRGMDGFEEDDRNGKVTSLTPPSTDRTRNKAYQLLFS